MKVKYQIVFLVCVSLILYYNSINHTVNSIDDYKMFNWLLNIGSINLQHLFFPHCGGYYRPLCILTYQIDRFLWFIEESFYHLENIIIHTLNAVLVFFIALKLFGKRYKLAPLFSALLFATHPINTEAVNWISARCDLLATSFSLSGFLVFLHFRDKKYWFFGTTLSAFIAFFGTLSKEVGVAFYPAIVMWILIFEKDNFKRRITEICIFVLFLVLYIYWRHFALMISDSSFHRVSAAVVYHHYFKDILIIIQAFGFYIKKLFIPFPLNFGIIHISKLYLYVGVVVAFTSGIFLYLRNKFFGLFLMALWFIAPGTLVALGHVAWTNYAERYVYTASAFFSIFFIVSLFKIFEHQPTITPRRCKYSLNRETVIVSLIIVLCFFFSFKRNLVWSSNLSLYRDTVEKSPSFVIARNQYAIALLKAGKIKEAKEQFTIAAKINDRTNTLPKLNTIIISDNESLQEKKEKLMKLYGKIPRLNNNILTQVIHINFKLIGKNPKQTEELYKENAKLFEKLYKNTHSGFYLYKIAQMYLAAKDNKNASVYLKKAKQHLNKNSIYYKAAVKLLSNLKKQSNK